MTDTPNTMTEKDDEEDLVIIEVGDDGKPLPAEGEQAPGGAAEGEPAKPEAEQTEDDDDGEDDRLAGSEDAEGDDDVVDRNRKRRKARADRRRRAEEMSKAELAELREIVSRQQQQLQQLNGHTMQNQLQGVAQAYQAKISEVQQAENVIARATEAGNGDDVVQAMRIRDEAIAEANRLRGIAQQMQQQQTQATPATAPQTRDTPQVAPEVITYAKQWSQQNPWFKPDGSDDDSKLALRIDKELAAEGFKPNTLEFWQELTDRLADEFGEAEKPAKPAGRRGPPTSSGRQHAPASTRKEIVVTPERKKAMIEAGVWDDPQARQRFLRSYRDFDNSSAR